MNDLPVHSMPEPVFQHPWHAQVFAVTVALNEDGRFSWPDWARRFSETLYRHGLSRTLDGGDDYFIAWLETLEILMVEQDMAAPREIQSVSEEWKEAFSSTPHGMPVRLAQR